MEGNDWYNKGYTDYRNHFRGDQRPVDEDVYRGAYRFDNTSPQHNETTYNGFDRRGERYDNAGNYDRRQENRDTGQYANYNDNRNNYRENDWDRNRMQNRNQRPHPRGYWMDEETQQPVSLYRSTHISGNFEDNYGRDPYNNYSDNQNYGNMAGSLSAGYDGNYNADFNELRYYDPLTGHRRSYHGNYTSRHPEPGNQITRHDPDRDYRDDYERFYQR
ncbi:hypothetical protein H7F15_03260 [Pontibacter sp. Tf4]|uniref:hypothetical protein n=1 Tax=Pontibacter sp. Tf4 TaxID=2761620 RepID=UPI00162A1E4B|nr:hypothetical protein [Pontibacter sp. Tf4]MBB6610045.1 hypothetical protein [Pontibacter sp. Tf4]